MEHSVACSKVLADPATKTLFLFQSLFCNIPYTQTQWGENTNISYGKLNDAANKINARVYRLLGSPKDLSGKMTACFLLHPNVTINGR